MSHLRRIIAVAIEPRTALLFLTGVPGLGATMYLALVALGATMQPLYFSLIVLMCAIGVASLYILQSDQQKAVIVYAWLAGICLAAMMLYDVLRGERCDHLYWVFPAGVTYIVIYVNAEHAFLYALGSSMVGALIGLCQARISYGTFYALMPLAIWLISASVADVILRLRGRVDDVEIILETWERAEQ